MRWTYLGFPGIEMSLMLFSVPEQKLDKILVDVRAAAIPAHIGQRSSKLLPHFDPYAPYAFGWDGVGVVRHDGRAKPMLMPGDRVAINILRPWNTDIRARAPDDYQCIRPISRDWDGGTYAEVVELEPDDVTPIPGLTGLSDAKIAAAVSRFSRPLSWLRRSNLQHGEILLVNGADGYYGSAVAMLGLFLGAKRVIVAARAREPNNSLIPDDRRIERVAWGNNLKMDAELLRMASWPDRPDVAVDAVGDTDDEGLTRTVLASLGQGGRLVLAGSMFVPSIFDYGPIVARELTIMGCSTIHKNSVEDLFHLVNWAGLDLDALDPVIFPLSELPAAIRASACLSGEKVAVVCLTPKEKRGHL